ncbi:hypothetical protein Micbo1qcDRAFT_177830 [Microdochium bolleyi]|uniref:FAD-binding domain-containing protein n=1 Tax=Microdochium bolleyi TaxID=196109 RepID=A0A136IVK0_9PEZI|nr:hypothetical protein Micbo1qcDRAFT_177830 [Microdochium bolleyi]
MSCASLANSTGSNIIYPRQRQHTTAESAPLSAYEKIMKIVIIGAGLGGLAAALRFAMLSHEVVVLEKHPALSPRGGSLSTRPGASRILVGWGLEADMDRIANRTEGIIMRDLATGATTSVPAAAGIAKGHGSQQAPHWGTTRQELIQLFHDKAVEYGAVIRFGCAVSAVHDEAGGDGVWVMLMDGTHISADLILAADGMRSRTRAAILADQLGAGQMEPAVSAVTGYGFALAAPKLQDPGIAGLLENVSSNVWMGGIDHAFAVSRYSEKGGFVAVLCHTIDDRNTEQDSLWDDKGDLEYVRHAFQGSCSAITRALELADSCDRWRLAELPSLPRWTSLGGSVVLLGDSAHAMHPSAGQGFSQIVEDIEVLAQLVSRSPVSIGAGSSFTPCNVLSITKAWQDIRKPRVEKIQEYSRWSTAQIAQRVSGSSASKYAPGQLENTKAMDEEFRNASFLPWTFDYDVEKEIDDYLSQKVHEHEQKS